MAASNTSPKSNNTVASVTTATTINPDLKDVKHTPVKSPKSLKQPNEQETVLILTIINEINTILLDAKSTEAEKISKLTEAYCKLGAQLQVNDPTLVIDDSFAKKLHVYNLPDFPIPDLKLAITAFDSIREYTSEVADVMGIETGAMLRSFKIGSHAYPELIDKDGTKTKDQFTKYGTITKAEEKCFEQLRIAFTKAFDATINGLMNEMITVFDLDQNKVVVKRLKKSFDQYKDKDEFINELVRCSISSACDVTQDLRVDLGVRISRWVGSNSMVKTSLVDQKDLSNTTIHCHLCRLLLKRMVDDAMTASERTQHANTLTKSLPAFLMDVKEIDKQIQKITREKCDLLTYAALHLANDSVEIDFLKPIVVSYFSNDYDNRPRRYYNLHYQTARVAFYKDMEIKVFAEINARYPEYAAHVLKKMYEKVHSGQLGEIEFRRTLNLLVKLKRADLVEGICKGHDAIDENTLLTDPKINEFYIALASTTSFTTISPTHRIHSGSAGNSG
ncbi:hypothetical protein AYO45_03315 [Gammaproteobacteria bacterium SCGC AG-212-F23]|nr:hypothetical protein AYO45_03315 [Gammaproteobacteria bacterium SCGC AG-212-F23]